MKKGKYYFFILATFIFLATNKVYSEDLQENHWKNDRKIRLSFANTTQGPLWPPSAIVNKDGDYVLVGTSIRPIGNGINIPVPNQAVLVSSQTVPPLNSDGIEDFSNPFGAAYVETRSLDLSDGSDDLEMELYANSFGPAVGNFGGGPRVPSEDDNPYNLNGASVKGFHCPELFPSNSQKENYKRDRFPLSLVPVPGFQGDQIAYNVDTGERYDPQLKNGINCPLQGCSGEDSLHVRPFEKVTLGKWLSAEVKASVRLIRKSKNEGKFTAANFKVYAKNLLPNSVYIVVAIRTSVFEPRPILKAPDPAALNSIIVTDKHGRGFVEFETENPFPHPDLDDAGTRILGLAIAYKSDYVASGLCPIRLGPGVDIHAVASTLGDPTTTAKLSQLITMSQKQ